MPTERACHGSGIRSVLPRTVERTFVTSEIDRSDEALAAAAEDFGHVCRGTARGVLYAVSAEDIAEAVTTAAWAGSGVTVRGTGHSAGGQAVPDDSMVFDLSRLNFARTTNK